MIVFRRTRPTTGGQLGGSTVFETRDDVDLDQAINGEGGDKWLNSGPS